MPLQLLTLFLALATCAPVLADATPPIASGTYAFRHKDAEFPESRGIPVTVIIRDYSITVVNKTPHAVLPKGVLVKGELMWHDKSGQWIIGTDEADRNAEEVGGCSAGPETVDFAKKIIWSCIGGP